MFSVRLVTADSYQAPPLPQLDPTFSEFRGCEIKNVPVIRIFGTTPAGEKTCLHVHGVFPYMYVPYDGEESEDRLAYRLAGSLDASINISLGSANSNTQHVYQIQRVAGIPFYGYHRREHQFLKISFYNPAIMKKAADLLQNGAVLGQSLQPHEAHINYILQFMIDYNLYGMSFINLSSIKYRRINQTSGDIISSYGSAVTQLDNVDYLPASVLRQSICEVEVDGIASDILNREDLAKGIELNPGLSAIWNEERSRREQVGLGNSNTQLVNPKSPERPTYRPTDSDLYQEQRLARRLLTISQCDESTLSMSTNSIPYPAEVEDGDVILNASNFGSLSMPTSDKTQRPNRTLSLSSLGTTQSSQGSHECSILDSDDLPLVELLDNLARDSDTKDSVDEDSILGTQKSEFDDNDNEKSDNENDNEDLNLTCMELESWSPWESANKLTSSQKTGKSSSVDDIMDKTLLDALLAAGIDSDTSESNESTVPQLDGAGDLCSSLLDSEEEDNMQMEVEHDDVVLNKRETYTHDRTNVMVGSSNIHCDKSIPTNSSSSPSTSSLSSDVTTASWSSVVPNDNYLKQYNTIDYEHFDEDFDDFDDIDNIMRMEMNFSNVDEVLVSSNLIEDEAIPIERVLNGDPCFTETAELDKSDLTELQDQYVSLLDNSLLPEIYELTQNQDNINNSTVNRTENSQLIKNYQDNLLCTDNIKTNQESDINSCSKNLVKIIDVNNENSKDLNRLTSDSSDYNCNIVATWEQIHDLQYLPKRTIKRKCTRKLKNQVKGKRKKKLTKCLMKCESSVVSDDHQEFNDTKTLDTLKLNNQLRDTFSDARGTLPGVQYSPYSLGDNENLVTPILADFEELINPMSSPINSPYCLTDYSTDRSHNGIIFGKDKHRHCVYSFHHRKFIQNYVFTSNEIWVIEKRKRGNANRSSAICDKDCHLPYVPLQKINIPNEIDESIDLYDDNDESLNTSSDSIAMPDNIKKDPNFLPPETSDIIGEKIHEKSKNNKKNTFTRVTRQSERNFVQSQTSTESGDGPVIIRRVFEEKTNGSTRVKKRKIILKVGSNTDSQSDDSKCEDKTKVPVKSRRGLRKFKSNVKEVSSIPKNSSELPVVKNLTSLETSLLLNNEIALSRDVPSKTLNRPQIICSIETRRLSPKLVLNLTINQKIKSKQEALAALPPLQPSLSPSPLSPPPPVDVKIRKVETLSQKYKLRVPRRESGKKFTTPEKKNGRIQITKQSEVTNLVDEQLDRLPELCGSIYRNEVALMPENTKVSSTLPDTPSVSNERIIESDEYKSVVAEVNLYSGKDYTIDAVSQEIPQCLFEEDSNNSLNEKVMIMMSPKRPVNEVDANPPSQSDNSSVKSFEHDDEEYSDHESGILSMADGDSGSNGTLNNDVVGDIKHSPNSFRALLINELQKGKRCERCEKCDCNSYMTRLTNSHEQPRTGSIRSDKIYFQDEKIDIVTKSIFRLIGEDNGINPNSDGTYPISSQTDSDDTLKDISDRNLDSDYHNDGDNNKKTTTPTSSPKKTTILRKIYSNNPELNGNEDVINCEFSKNNKSIVNNSQINQIDSSENDNNTKNTVTFDSIIGENKIVNELREIDNEQSSQSKNPEAYLHILLEGGNNTELIINNDDAINSEETLSSRSVITNDKDYNFQSFHNDKIQKNLSSRNYNNKLAENIRDKTVNDGTENLKTRSTLIYINEDTRDTFVMDENDCNNEIENYGQTNLHLFEDSRIADTFIMNSNHDSNIRDKISRASGTFGDDDDDPCLLENSSFFNGNSLSLHSNIDDSMEKCCTSVIDTVSRIEEAEVHKDALVNGELSVENDVPLYSGEFSNSLNIDDKDDEGIIEGRDEIIFPSIDNIEEIKTFEDEAIIGIDSTNDDPQVYSSIGERLEGFEQISSLVSTSSFEQDIKSLETDKMGGDNRDEKEVQDQTLIMNVESTENVELISNSASQILNESSEICTNALDEVTSISEVLSPCLDHHKERAECVSEVSSSLDEKNRINENHSSPISSVSKENCVESPSIPQINLISSSSSSSSLQCHDIQDEPEFLSSPEASPDETINGIIDHLDDDEELSTNNELLSKTSEKIDEIISSNESEISNPQEIIDVIPLIHRIKSNVNKSSNALKTTSIDSTKKQERVGKIKCPRVSVKLERLNPNLIAQYLNKIPLASNINNVIPKIKKHVKFSSEIEYFELDEKLSTSEYEQTESDSESNNEIIEVINASNVIDDKPTSKRTRAKVQDEITELSSVNSSINSKINDEPKSNKRAKIMNNVVTIELNKSHISKLADEIPEILNNCESPSKREKMLGNSHVEKIPSKELPAEKVLKFDKVPEVFLEKIPEVPQSFQVVDENLPKFEFTRRSKIPSKRSHSPSSLSPTGATILSSQSLQNSILHDLQSTMGNRYLKTYTIRSPYQTKIHTVSVDKRLVLSQITIKNAKFDVRTEKEDFLYQLGLYSMNPKLCEWQNEVSHCAYFQRQQPKVQLYRLDGPTLKRYGYTRRFKSNKFGKRFLNGSNDFRLPAFDGPADFSSSDSDDSDNETNKSEAKEKKVCTYKSGKCREIIATPKKRKHPDGDDEIEPKTTKSRRSTPVRASLRSPLRSSMLKSPGGLSGNYTPLNIIVTSPKVRKDNSVVTEQSRICADGNDDSLTTYYTPRRRERGLHENLLRGKMTVTTPGRRSGNASKQEVTSRTHLGEFDDTAITPGNEQYQSGNDLIMSEEFMNIERQDLSIKNDQNVRKNLFTDDDSMELREVNNSPKPSTSKDVEIFKLNDAESDADKTLLFDDDYEDDFKLRYSTMENSEFRENEEEDDLCNVTFTQYIGTQLSKNSQFPSNRKQIEADPNKSMIILPRYNPPSVARIKETMNTYGIPQCRNLQPFFSIQADAPGQKELAHKILKVPGKGLADVAIFKSTVENLTGLNRWRRMKINEFHPTKGKIQSSSIRQSLSGHGSIVITPLITPPSIKNVKTWLKAREYLKKKKKEAQENNFMEEKINEKIEHEKCIDSNDSNSSNSSIVEASPEKIIESNSLRFLGRTPKILQTRKVLSSGSSDQSIISVHETIQRDKNTPPNATGLSEMGSTLMSMMEKSELFKEKNSKHLGMSCGQIDCLTTTTRSNVSNENRKNAKAIHTYQYLTLMAIEVHVTTRGDLLPDPEHDPVSAVFYAIQSDVPPTSPVESLKHGVIAVAPEGSKKLGYAYGSNVPFDIKLVASEGVLFESFIDLVTRVDPEIFIGWELEALSWGYIFQRATTFGVNLNKRISRIPGVQCKWEATTPDLDALGEIKLPGRVVLDIWRIMRHEMALLSYSFENVMYHVMNERIPCPSFKKLTEWWSLGGVKERWKVVEHYSVRVLGVLRILEQLDIIGRTSEHARLFGIQFYEVFTRGSQFRVESIMLRLAKPLNYIPVSPSMQQRASMRAMEALPLIMEPESVFYHDPVIVLDFQSLYPSIIIAHNYCFSTCIGRIEHIGQPHPFPFGATVLKVTKNTALKLEGKVNYAPCGVAFVKQDVRLGILPRMLTEILETRFMVKKAMKDHDQNDKTLQRVLHSRQLGLKFLANVTYGYTAANFTGRMPCMEVGDSVVSKAKETLERAIKLVESTPKWGTRVVYGDTDSLFILAPGKSKEEAFKIGYEIADAVTASNPKPIKLKFEKILFPTILQTKKRYCGYMWESPNQEKPTYLAKGIETVRRDGCPAVSKILEKSLKILFDTKDVSQVKNYVVRQLDKVLRGKVSIQDLTFAKEFRGMRGYKEKACVPALELTRRLMKKDPRALPRHSERVKYVIVAGAPNQALIHCVRSPWELINDPGLRPNAVYYVTRVIIPPLNRCLNLMGVDVNNWYKEMPHRHILDNPIALPIDKHKQTIFQYFGNIVCAACGQTSSKALCTDCQLRPTDTLIMLHEKLRWLERINDDVVSLCRSCVGRSDTSDCVSLDCPVLYRRANAQRELTQGVQLEQIIKQTIDL